MPGRLMSMSTTSGLSFGSDSSAASALGYWLRQRKPSSRLMSFASVVRNCSLSSTMDTEVPISFNILDGHSQAHQRAAAGRVGDRKTAADIFHSFVHVAQ